MMATAMSPPVLMRAVMTSRGMGSLGLLLVRPGSLQLLLRLAQSALQQGVLPPQVVDLLAQARDHSIPVDLAVVHGVADSFNSFSSARTAASSSRSLRTTGISGIHRRSYARSSMTPSAL